MTRVKTFIGAVPFLLKDKLMLAKYEPQGNSKLEYPDLTRFPMIPMINGYAEKGDKIRIIAILTGDESYRYNYDTHFVPEINALVERNEYDFSGIEIINTPDCEDIDTQLKLFADIIAKISDNEDLHVCITYGTKPTPIVQFIALNYAAKHKENISIKCVAYGLYKFDDDGKDNVGYIYDQTALFYANSIVGKLADMNAPNPEAAIKALLGVGDYEDEE